MCRKNMKRKEEVALLQNMKKRLETLEMSVWMSCVLLLLVVVLAVLPGFVILAHAQSLLLDTPTSDSFVLWILYGIKAVVACVWAVVGTVCYADMAFPAVMETFVLILNHTALPESIHRELSCDVGGTGNISELSNQSRVID